MNDHCEIEILGGGSVAVCGTLGEVEARLRDALRSDEFVRFTEYGTDRQVAVGARQVTVIRPGGVAG
jgi:hypothetical protein